MRKSTLLISKKDLIMLSNLLHKGYSIPDSLLIIGGYEQILEQLEKGKDFRQFIDFHSKDPFYRSLEYFLSFSSLDQAILSAHQYHETRKVMKKDWLKEISYPIGVLFFALLVFIFFEIMIYPQLMSLIDIEKKIYLHQLLYGTIGLLLVSIFLNSVILLYLFLLKRMNHLRFNQFYLDHLGKLSLIKKMISYDYALHSLILMQRGFSTKQVFECLLELKNNIFLQLNLKHMTSQLQKGEEMVHIIEHEPYFDERFKQFFKLGYYTLEMENTLSDYCEYQKNEFKKILKRSSTIISTCAYMLIAILIVSIYQLLLLPLDMMNQF